MDNFRALTTREKALKINLNPHWYGSFAEIGAGQETAAHFFKAGGASGTIAKTMSAYDMKFSDAIYGKSKRYVSRARVESMLEHEFSLLEERLTAIGDQTCFFAMANTIETLNYKKTNQGHGWIGIRFQLSPGTPPNNVIMHVVMRDTETLWQQEAVGIIGVNLIYACYHYPHDTDAFLKCLMEGLSSDRIDVDMFSLTGPNFDWVDNRLLSLKLVKNDMTKAAMFGADGKILHVADVLYKKNILVLRGRFRPATLVNLDMLKSARAQFLEEEDVKEEDTLVIAELTLNNLTTEGKIDDDDFLDRVDMLRSMGVLVMVSSYHKYYSLVSYFTQYTRKKKIGIALGVYNLEQVFDEQYYTKLKGGILESFGTLFGANIKMYVYPALADYSQELYTCRNFKLPKEELHYLFQYIFSSNKVEDIRGVDPDLLHITSDAVLSMIKNGEDGWERMVPPEVEKAIKTEGLFGYQSPTGAKSKALK
ncbi:MAG: TonB-dependent receptor [Bacteroidota bacterium]